MEAVFAAHGIRNDKTAVTENKNKPDFIFLGISEYRSVTFLEARLTMLAAKTSAKDHWRQILGEADRITLKYLITLEPGISENQTDEMKARQVSRPIPCDPWVILRRAAAMADGRRILYCLGCCPSIAVPPLMTKSPSW